MEQKISPDTGMQSHPVSFIYFYSDDCAPCSALRTKIITLLANHFPGLPITMIDGKANPQMAASHGVLSLPALILLAEGREYRRYGIYTSISQIQSDIEKLLVLLAPEKTNGPA